MTKVLLVDHHALFRQALAFALAREPRIQVSGQAGSVVEAQRLQKDWTVVVAELSLPDGDGADIIHALRATDPNVRVLILTTETDRVRLSRAVEAGAHGVLPKAASLAEITEAILRVDRGEHLM